MLLIYAFIFALNLVTRDRINEEFRKNKDVTDPEKLTEVRFLC